MLTVLLVRMRHHFDVFGYRERVIELSCWFGCGIVLNIWATHVRVSSLPGRVALWGTVPRRPWAAGRLSSNRLCLLDPGRIKTRIKINQGIYVDLAGAYL